MAILDLFRLDGKVAIVTGGARGLGQGMAVALADAGAAVAIVDVLDTTETENRIEELGKKCVGIKADLTSTECVNEIVATTAKELGRIDILVNCAGMIRRSPLVEFSEEDWDDVMNLNIRTLFFLSQAVARFLIRQGEGGKIINIASMLSFQGGMLTPSYTASKAGVMGLTRALANELAQHNINVNAIAPGYMATPNTAAIRADPARSEAVLKRIPAGRWGNAEDLQGVAVFLASDASAYMNGFTVAVDGGWLSR